MRGIYIVIIIFLNVEDGMNPDSVPWTETRLEGFDLAKEGFVIWKVTQCISHRYSN